MNPRTGHTHRAGSMFEVALASVSQYQTAKTRKQFRPQFARFKMKFYYTDGNASVHYSYDFYHSYDSGIKKRIDDEMLGYSKLLKCIQKNEGKYISVVIWAIKGNNKATDQHGFVHEVFKHVRGNNPVTNESLLRMIAEKKF